MRTAIRVLCLALAGLAFLPGPAAHAGSKGTFRVGAGAANEPFEGPYQIGDIKIRGCYGLIFMPKADLWGGGTFVLLLIDSPDRVASVRWIGFHVYPVVKKEKEAKYFERLVSGKEKVPGIRETAGKIELQPLEQGSRKRYGRLKYLQIWRSDETTGSSNWTLAPEPSDLLCFFESRSGQAPGAPASGDWDIALDDLPASMVLSKAAGEWKLTIPGSAQTAYPCSADLTPEKVTIECRYREDFGNGNVGPYLTYRFTGSMSGDGTAMKGTYTYTSSATKDPKDDPEQVVSQSGKWKATRRQDSGP